MTNGDRVRTFSNEQLALILMCPKGVGLDDTDCTESEKNSCVKCVYDWLNAEEAE